jgi:Fe-S-cluster containining protein
MLPVIVLGLALAVIVTIAFVIWAFVEVAFRQPGPAAPRREPAFWRPPIIAGQDLFAWAARVAKTLTLQRLSEPRSEKTAGRIAEAIGHGASNAIALAKDELPAAHDTACPSRSCGRRMITATAAEVLAIADAVHHQGHRAAEHIRRRAEDNVQRAAALGPQQYLAADIICPLMTSDGHCATYDVRPLQCRAWCKLCDSDGAKCMLTGEANAYTISQGIEEGLATALADAGLDGHVYELNSALAAALANPDASLHWAVGEPVFAGCREA